MMNGPQAIQKIEKIRAKCDAAVRDRQNIADLQAEAILDQLTDDERAKVEAYFRTPPVDAPGDDNGD